MKGFGMAPLDLNVSTVVVLLILTVLVFLAVRRIVGRGLCDSGGSCDSCSSCPSHGGSGGCPSCAAAEKLIADVERAANAASKG